MYVDYLDDDHRISLVPLPNFPECQNNYINASYIDVCKFNHNVVTNIHNRHCSLSITFMTPFRAFLRQTSSLHHKVYVHTLNQHLLLSHINFILFD